MGTDPAVFSIATSGLVETQITDETGIALSSTLFTPTDLTQHVYIGVNAPAFEVAATATNGAVSVFPTMFYNAGSCGVGMVVIATAASTG